MRRADDTKDALLEEARRQFWARGYSAVPLREITRAVGVDVALVSRYFGSKRQLFEATLEVLPGLNPEMFPTPEAVIERVVDGHVNLAWETGIPSPTSMLITNAADPEVGAVVRAQFLKNWQRPLEQILGDPERAALMTAAVLGVAVCERSLGLDGIAARGSAGRSEQLRTLLRAVVLGGEAGET